MQHNSTEIRVIPALRNFIEKKNNETKSPEKCLYVYDKAVSDYTWRDQQKKLGNDLLASDKDKLKHFVGEKILFDIEVSK